MRGRRGATLVVATTMLAGLLGGSAGNAAGACDTATTTGCWDSPFSPNGEFDGTKEPNTIEESMKYPAAASAVVLPSGKILYWNGLQNLESSNVTLALDAGRTGHQSASWILDLGVTKPGTHTPLFYPANPEFPDGDDLFCTDQRLAKDGRVIAAGGTRWKTEDHADIPDEVTGPDGPDGLAELYGSKNTHVYTEPDEDAAGAGKDWTLAKDMKHARWYPTLITMPDGRLFVAGGVKKLLWNSNLAVSEGQEASGPLPQNVVETEIFDPASDTWTENPATANAALPLFARMHLLPNGEVFYSGAGQMWGPAGESVDQLEWNKLRAIDPQQPEKGWREMGTLTLGARSGAFSAMLPLRPNADGEYDEAKILLGGGVLGTSPGSYIATNLSEIVTLSKDANGTWNADAELTSPLNNRRWFSSAVTLPNGEVVAINGAEKDEVIMPGFEQPVRQAEIWNGSEWKPLGSTTRDRTYHNSAFLLPDGSVLVGGHAPINNFYGGSGDGTWDDNGFGSNNLKDPSFERLYPPYLYGNRPVIESSGTNAAHNGGPLNFVLKNDSVDIAKVVLSRLPSVTHGTDADARTVEVPFAVTETAADKPVTVSVPSSTSVVPPGYYYVFALSSDGTPSHALIVNITP